MGVTALYNPIIYVIYYDLLQCRPAMGVAATTLALGLS
jgi:hypothetical protein